MILNYPAYNPRFLCGREIFSVLRMIIIYSDPGCHANAAVNDNKLNGSNGRRIWVFPEQNLTRNVTYPKMYCHNDGDRFGSWTKI